MLYWLPNGRFIVPDIEKLSHTNPFLVALVGCIAMEQLRAAFSHPVPAYSDCESVITLLRHTMWRPPGLHAEEILWPAPPRDSPSQPLIAWVPSHVNRTKPSTKTQPKRVPIPQDQRTPQMWTNLIADEVAGLFQLADLPTSQHFRRHILLLNRGPTWPPSAHTGLGRPHSLPGPACKLPDHLF